ncbi:hypothetical protein QUF76_15710 [Desulfobacterales bacterium HSG16]|nr:hypothetical protein [Desulfobacterales bacterium HSG16]
MVNFKKYLFCFFSINLVSMLLVSIVVFKAFFIDSIFSYQKLYHYQIDKIATSNDIDTVFVGDSSLGNCIDTDLFNEMSSINSLNLALTGLYGYAGTYNMIKKAVKKHHIKNVIIIHTLDMMKRKTSYKGYLYTLEKPYDLNITEWSRAIETFFNILFSPKTRLSLVRYHRGLIDPFSIDIVNDYIEQHKKRIDITKDVAGMDEKLNTDKIRFLIKIRNFCRNNNINLIYVHGPIWRPIGEESKKYINKINQTIEKLGIKLLKNVPLISDISIGDNNDHVASQYKKDYTLMYYEQIKSHLLTHVDPTIIKEH